MAATLLLTLGCGNSDGPSPDGGREPEMASADFAPELSVDLGAMERRPSGLYVLDVVEGGGREAVDRSPVFVQYSGWLPDGTRFASSRERGGFSFMLGVSDVLPVWQQGVRGMKKGGVRRLVVPPELGYGPHGSGDSIPPNSPLVYEVELLEVLPPAPLGPGPGDTVDTEPLRTVPLDSGPPRSSGPAREDRGPEDPG